MSSARRRSLGKMKEGEEGAGEGRSREGSERRREGGRKREEEERAGEGSWRGSAFSVGFKVQVLRTVAAGRGHCSSPSGRPGARGAGEPGAGLRAGRSRPSACVARPAGPRALRPALRRGCGIGPRAFISRGGGGGRGLPRPSNVNICSQ